MKPKVILQRYKGDHNQTTGTLTIFDKNGWPVFSSPCIERGYRDNKKNVSNIPMGIYPLLYEYSPKFDMFLWELKEVPGRSECKIHASNYWHQLNGCIAPGRYLKDLNNDGYQDVGASRITLKDFNRVMYNHFDRKADIQIVEPLTVIPF